jgi:hypothetical protein
MLKPSSELACSTIKEWAAPAKEQGQILALSAQLEQLKSKRSQTKQPIASGAIVPPEKKPKRAKNPEWAWKDVMPKSGEPTTKDFEGKHYHIGCKFHPNRWVCHPAEDCSLNPANIAAAASSATPSSGNEETKAASRRLKKAKLAAALLEEEEETEEDDDSVTS